MQDELKTKIIGLTGGIGSGKTTIARCFESLGVPVYIADSEAKKLMETPLVVNKIKDIFGTEVVNGICLDRKQIAQIVFNDIAKLEQLNAIIHPLVKEQFEKWVLTHKNCPFVIKETAVLFESGSYKDCDEIIVVVAPEEIRIDRVMRRDHVNRKEVLDRIKNQWSDDQKKVLSNYIIDNTDLEIAKKQVKIIYRKIKK